MITLKNINKYYMSGSEKYHALRDINITFPDKGLVAIVGKSGSGKSTLLNVIGGIDGYDSGELIIDDLKKKYIRANFGFGAFDIIIKAENNIGIIISGSKTEDIYSNIDVVNFFKTTYERFGWNVILIDVLDFVNDYSNTLNKIIDLCKK